MLHNQWRLVDYTQSNPTSHVKDNENASIIPSKEDMCTGSVTVIAQVLTFGKHLQLFLHKCANSILICWSGNPIGGTVPDPVRYFKTSSAESLEFSAK